MSHDPSLTVRGVGTRVISGSYGTMEEPSGIGSGVRQLDRTSGVGSTIRQRMVVQSERSPSGLHAHISLGADHDVEPLDLDDTGIALIPHEDEDPSGFATTIRDGRQPSGFRAGIPGDYHVALRPVEDDYEVALTPAEDTEDDPGEIFTGIYGEGAFREKGLEETNPDQIAANTAFKEWYAEVAQLVRAGKIGKPGERIQDMMVLDGTKEVEITLVNARGKTREITLTVGEVKEKMIRHRMDTTGAPRRAVAAQVEQDVESHFRAFDRVFKKGKISRVEHYSASGNARGSALNKKALELTKHSPEILHKKQAKDLILASDLGLSEQTKWKGLGRKKESGPLSFIGRIEGATPDETKAKQKKAVDRVLRAESYGIQLREKLTKRIDELNREILATDDPDEKDTLRARRNSYTELRDQLENDTNRHALYVAAVFGRVPVEGRDLEECYNAVLQDLYEEVYANESDENKPSFSEFVRSGTAEPFRKYAAEVASTLIVHPGQYRRYCREHGIEPKKDHINVFLNQALLREDNDDELANFDVLDISFDEEGEEEIRVMMSETREQVDQIFGGMKEEIPEVDDLDDEEDPLPPVSSPLIDILDDGSKTPEERLKAALEDEQFKGLFVDHKTTELHGTATRVKQWWNKPHWFNRVSEAPTALAAAANLLRI
jgi:hypothetical protein